MYTAATFPSYSRVGGLPLWSLRYITHLLPLQLVLYFGSYQKRY